MNILVIGCGTVGSALASKLSEAGHDVSVVDSDPTNFLQLSPGFRGMTYEGLEYDQEVLLKAGIKACDVAAVVTHDDNLNIMAAQIAGRVFGVNKVLTRIYDPERESVYSEMGLRTICPTKLTVDAVYSAAVEADTVRKTLNFGLSTVSFEIRGAGPECVGMTAKEYADVLAEDRVLLYGLMHSGGDITMTVEHPERKIGSSDRLVLSVKVD